jgi:hypothetical protein
MTRDEVLRSQQRITEMRTARRAEIDAAARPPVTAADRVGAPFRAGDRVLDRRTGREGTVSDVGAPDRSGAVSVAIAFDDGSSDTRAVVDLLARPRLPTARP